MPLEVENFDEIHWKCINLGQMPSNINKFEIKISESYKIFSEFDSIG